jgi:hypothetical protein
MMMGQCGPKHVLFEVLKRWCDSEELCELFVHTLEIETLWAKPKNVQYR